MLVERMIADRMTAEQRARADLTLAQRGDSEAQQRVALYVYHKYLPRARRLATKTYDPVMSVQDIESSFFEAIFRHVPLLDGRGDDFYHAAQRGVWAVQSEMRAIRIRSNVENRKWAGLRPDDERDPAYDAEDMDASDAFVRAEDSLEAIQRVHVITSAPLRARHRQALDAIAAGKAGDPRDKGFNAQLAAALEVSPQRASQIMGEIREAVAQ